MAKYTSGRQKNLKVGIVSYSENLTSLEVIGNVGIGTTIASANLQVNGSVILGGKSTDLINIPGKISSNFYPNGDGLYDVGRAPQIGLGANRWNNANFSGKGIFDSGVGAHDIEIGVGAANLIYSTSGNLELNAQSGTTNVSTILTISGNTGIGTLNPTSKLTVQGDVLVTGIATINRLSSPVGTFTTVTANDYNSISDFNFKKNIKPFENALDKVVQINGVTFEWKNTNSQSAGIIAQDVEKVFPELVNNGDFKTVNYNGLIGVLIESIKELKQEVDELKKKINTQ